MGQDRSLYRILVGKLEGKKPLGRPRRRWENNIKMDLQDLGCGGMDWIELAQDRDKWRTVYRVLVGKTWGKEILGRPRRRWENNIKMDLQEVRFGVIDWIDLAQDRDKWRTVYRVLVGKTWGKERLGRPRRRWENNIKMDLQEVRFGDIDWIDLAQDKDKWRTLVNAVMDVRSLLNAGNFFDYVRTG